MSTVTIWNPRDRNERDYFGQYQHTTEFEKRGRSTECKPFLSYKLVFTSDIWNLVFKRNFFSGPFDYQINRRYPKSADMTLRNTIEINDDDNLSVLSDARTRKRGAPLISRATRAWLLTIPYNSENKPRGLYFVNALFEGPIFGGAYLRREICVSKLIGLAL